MTIFTDNGSCFKLGKKSVFDEFKFGRHVYFPSVTHCAMSTCDNGVNSISKNAWRNANRNGLIPYIEQPKSTLYLMAQYDLVKSDQIKLFWDRNLLSHNFNSLEESVKKVVTKTNYNHYEFHEGCKRLREIFEKEN